MRVGGYTMKDQGYALQVTEIEAGWSFFLQGEDAEWFKEHWEDYQEQFEDGTFRHFLSIYEYDTLFQ